MQATSGQVICPLCSKSVSQILINQHIDSGCQDKSSSSNSSGQNKSFLNAFGIKKDGGGGGGGDVRGQTKSSSQSSVTLPTSPPAEPLKRSIEENKEDNAATKFPIHPLKRQKISESLGKSAPLAERMRPTTMDEVCGQDLLGPSGVLRAMIEKGQIPSMLLWGGPGCGKTTIARVIARTSGSKFVEINSTDSGVAECKKLFAEAKSELLRTGKRTILFCDEIHRFSKAQQDVFLGPVESGQIILIGATTENPSFKVQNALLSRCRTFTLSKLSEKHITEILNRALTSGEISSEDETLSRTSELIDDEMISYLAAFADGDGRTALNLLELATNLSSRPKITKEDIKKALTRTMVYDRKGDGHYDTISAFHKSVRGSDVDASLYYLARMIKSGEDALFIARRLVVIASEDVGLADNSMLSLATATYTACEKIGLPECRISLAHATVALAMAPKSTRSYRAYGAVVAALDQEPALASLPIPVHLRNAPTRLMKELGYGKDYKYPPSYRDGLVKQEYMPPELQGRAFLEDDDFGDQIDPELEDQDEELTDDD